MNSQTAVSNSTGMLQETGQRMNHLPFLWLLLFITLVALSIRLYVGAQTFMSWDEWEHVFIASGARGIDVRFELNIDAHPPLHITLLRGLLHFGHSKLLYRFISILSGAGSVFLIGLIGWKICCSPVVALLCASAFALSEVAISVGVEVRSYELTVFLVLLAFLFYLELTPRVDNQANLRPYMFFSIATALAVACHYFAGLFLGACLIIAPFLVLASLKDGRGLRQFINSRSLLLLAVSLIVPLGVLAFFYLRHARSQLIQGYLYDFYWGQTPYESKTAFLLRNLQNFWNLFSPVMVQSHSTFLITAAIVCCGAGYILYASRKIRGSEKDASTVFVMFPVVMIIELIILSYARKYPFGGLLRHQYILAPFLVLAAFVLVDRLSALLTPRFRVAILILTGAAIAINAALPRPNLIMYPGQTIYSREFNNYRSAFPNARGVYLDRFGSIAYFSHTNEQPRHFVRSIADVVLIDQYHIHGGSPEGTEIFYDKTRGNLDLTDQTIYGSLASVLRQSGLKELTLFYFRAGDKPFDQTPDVLKRVIADTASAQGVAAKKVVIDRSAVYASFALR